jgi:shikimate kinase
MNGRARTTGAITITNALSAGIGCAAGITLPVEAEVAVESDGSNTPPTIEVSPESRSPVVEESVRVGLSIYHHGIGGRVKLSVRSAVPAAKGLKSSSAVSTAVVLALARAAGSEPSPLEVGRRSAEIGRRVGVSVTGALDDALAGLEPGFIVTDNRRDELLRRTEIDPDWGVVLYIPRDPHPRSPGLVPAFARERSSGERAARAALDGDWVNAMRVNTELVERAMGYSYRSLRERLRDHGAIASGVSGFGPTLAVIAPSGRLEVLARELPTGDAETRIVQFARASATGEEGA